MNARRTLRLALCIVAVIALLPGVSFARNAGKGEVKAGDVSIRLLPVGDPPPWRELIQNGQRQPLPPPAGAVPPMSIWITEEKVDENGPQPVFLSLGTVSRAIRVPVGTIHLHQAGQAPETAEPWHTLQVGSDDSLVLLWCDPEEKAWSRARSLAVPESAAFFPAGTVRIVNVSPSSVGISLGERQVAVEPETRVFVTVRNGRQLRDL